MSQRDGGALLFGVCVVKGGVDAAQRQRQPTDRKHQRCHHRQRTQCSVSSRENVSEQPLGVVIGARDQAPGVGRNS
ncbi:MAG TPA: hypothetical protein VFY45_02895, partial [Baekduia sp.]|nr:hypothetical protein [Baekduia sp.]